MDTDILDELELTRGLCLVYGDLQHNPETIFPRGTRHHTTAVTGVGLRLPLCLGRFLETLRKRFVAANLPVSPTVALSGKGPSHAD